MSLLADNHIVNLAGSAFNMWVISTRSCPSRKTLVSSANKIANNVPETFGRSLMQSKKNRDPWTEPWETPHMIGFCFELFLSIEIYCCLFARQHSINFKMLPLIT